MLLAFGITAILGIIAIVTSATMAVVAYQSRPEVSEASEGSRLGPRENRTEPGAPSPWGGGAPRWRAPLLSRTLSQPNLNSESSFEAKPRMRLVYDTGTGPMDGGDLNVWLDKTPIFESVVASSTLSERRLTDVQGARKEWFFPKSNVQKSDARIFLDGEIYGVTAEDTLQGLDTTSETVKTYSPEQYVVANVPEPESSRDYKYSASMVVSELAWYRRENVRVYADFVSQADYRQARNDVYDNSTSTGWVLLTKDQYKTVRDPDGKLRIILTDAAETRYTSPVKQVQFLRSRKARSLKVEYEYAYRDVREFSFFSRSFFTYTPCEIFEVETNDAFRSKAIFDTAIPSGEVTATYKTLPFGVEISTFFQPGDLDQPVVPLDLLGQSRAVNLQLAQAIRRTYSSTVAVDDMVVGIASGPGGFFRGSNTGPRPTDVRVEISYKLSDAPDADAQTYAAGRDPTQPAGIMPPGAYDPSTGWVKAKFKKGQKAGAQNLLSNTQGGVARWAFRLSDAWRFNLDPVNGEPGSMIGKLPRGKYDIRVTRLDSDDNYDGQRELFLETVTETFYDPLNFPGRSFLAIEFEEQEGLDSTPEVEVQFKMRKCRQYTGMAHVSRGEQLSRWLAAKGAPYEIMLPDGTVVITGGPQLNLGDFVYDPNLMEPQFDIAWTRNPVWIATELIIDDLSGGGVGGYDARTSVNWESAKRAADYCDMQILYDSVTATRSEADIVFTRRLELYDAASQILAGSGVAPVFSRGQWFFPIDDDSIDPDPVTDKLTGQPFEITDDDILDGEIDGDSINVVEGLTFDTKDVEGTATDLEITFPDEEAGFDQSADPVFIPASDVSPIRNVRRMSMPAVRRRWQVERAGNAMMIAEENNKRVANVMMAGLRTIVLDPGDIIVFGSETAKLDPIKAQVIERASGSNLRMELKLLLLGGSQVFSGPFRGPSGGVVPGLRTPTVNATANLVNSSLQTASRARSGVKSVEEL